MKNLQKKITAWLLMFSLVFCMCYTVGWPAVLVQADDVDEQPIGHQHTFACYEDWELICGDEAHNHTLDCYSWPEGAEPVCGLEAGAEHVHNADGYKCEVIAEHVLVCGKEETELEKPPVNPDLRPGDIEINDGTSTEVDDFGNEYVPPEIIVWPEPEDDTSGDNTDVNNSGEVTPPSDNPDETNPDESEPDENTPPADQDEPSGDGNPMDKPNEDNSNLDNTGDDNPADDNSNADNTGDDNPAEDNSDADKPSEDTDGDDVVSDEEAGIMPLDDEEAGIMPLDDEEAGIMPLDDDESGIMPLDDEDDSASADNEMTVDEDSDIATLDEGTVVLKNSHVPLFEAPMISDDEKHQHNESCYADIYQCRPVLPEEPKHVVHVKNEEELKAAIEAAPIEGEPGIAGLSAEGEELLKPYVILDNDINVSATLQVTAEVTLDLNGKTLTYDNVKDQNNDSLLKVENNAVLIITDTSSEIVDPARVVTYQVMRSSVNPDGFSTTETVEDHSVDLSMNGSITAKNEIYTGGSKNESAIIIVDGGKLILNDGVIDGNNGKVRGVLVKQGEFEMAGGAVLHCAVKAAGNPHGGGVCIENGTMTMTGGVIAENSGNLYHRGSGIALENGQLDISGGAVVNNRAGVGGGIYAVDGSGTINLYGNAVIAGNDTTLYGYGGGIAVEGEDYTLNIADDALITMNKAGSRGGGIDIGGSKFTLNISGGQITGNESAIKFQGYLGGGICAHGSGHDSVTMTGGIIANNTTLAGGGGISLINVQPFKMSGGYITNNRARDCEGGGIRVDGSSIEITQGYITQNETETHEHWGGGGIFISGGSNAKISNLLMTDNVAQGLGGGLAGCSTGQLAIFADDGLASFNNEAKGLHGSGGTSAKREDQAALNSDAFKYYGSNDFYCAHTSLVSDSMLGGGSANWHGSWDGNNTYVWEPSLGRYTIDVEPLAIAQGQFAGAKQLMGLSAQPSGKDMELARSAAKVVVSGNKSYTHGGGIMCNGVLFIGSKTIEREEFSSLAVEATKLYQDKDGKALGIYGGEFCFDLVSADNFAFENGKPIYSEADALTARNDRNGKVLFSIPDLTELGEYTYYMLERPGADAHIEYDPTIYKVIVEVTSQTSVSWEIDTKVTATVYNGKVDRIVEMIVDDAGQLVEKADDDVLAAEVGVAEFVNIGDGNPGPETTSLTVEKKWEHGTNPENKRPTEVTVQLLRNGEAMSGADSQVKLNKDNGFTYTWPSLMAKDNSGNAYVYTVREVETPEGYTANVSEVENGKVTITNTYQEPELTSLTITKRVNGPAPADTQFSFAVFLNGSETADYTFSLKADETYTISNLPIGTTYRVEETDNGGADNTEILLDNESVETAAGNLTSDENKVTFTNTFVKRAESTKLTVTKVWNHGTNPEDKWPTEVTVQLLRNDVVMPGAEYQVVLNAGLEPGWTYTWDNLAAEDNDGNAYVYTVQEVETPEGYTAEIPKPVDGKVTITNTYNEPETGSLAITKRVNGPAPADAQFSFAVFLNGSETPTYNFSLKAGETHTISNLPVGTTYRVEETGLAGAYRADVVYSDQLVAENGATNSGLISAAGEIDEVTVTNFYRETPPTPVTPVTPDNPNDDNSGGDDEPQLPNPNEPGSPDEVTILENDVPLTYIKVQDPETEEYVYLPEEEVPLADMEVPKTGDNLLLWLFAALASGLVALGLGRKRG